METVIRGALVYLILHVITRIIGRRSLSQVTAFDFVLLLVIAQTTQQALLGADFSFTNAIILVITLALIDIGISLLKHAWPAAAELIDGTPTVLVAKGEPDMRALRRSRVSLSDVLQAARQQHGLRTLAEVDFAVLEVGGTISIIPVAA